MNLSIKFEQIDPAAKADSSVTLQNVSEFSTAKDLEKELKFVDVQKFATLENNHAILDGTFEDFPNDTTGVQFGLWSVSASNMSGAFAQPPKLTATFSTLHKSAGITLYFYQFSSDWASLVRVTWYNNDIVLHTAEYDVNGTEWGIRQAVTNWNKIEVEFLKTNVPYRFVKLRGIDYGVIREFTDKEINTAKVLEEFNPISDNISINTANFQIKTHDAEFSHISGRVEDDMLMRNQRLYIAADGVPFGTYFLQGWKANSTNNTFDFEAFDALGAIDRHDFMGGMYKDTPLNEIISQIWDICFPTRVISYKIDADLLNYKINGFIPICTCRGALQNIAFSIGAAVDSTRQGFIWIYKRDTTDIAHEAVITASDKESFSNTALLTEEKDNVSIANIGTLEYNQTILDGLQSTMPDNAKQYDFPLWTASISDANGNFEVPPAIDTVFDGYHSSKEITLYFYPFSNDYATAVRATWYNSYNEEMHTGLYTFDSVIGVIEQPIINYRRVKIEFLSTNVPFRRVKLWHVDFGLGDRIKLDRIYLGSGFTQRTEYYSGLAITAYQYTESEEAAEPFKGMAAAGRHEVRFSEPLHSLNITGGKIVQSGTNYAIFEVKEMQEVLLSGFKYIESKSIYNISSPIAAGEAANVVTFEGATLVTPDIVAERAADLWDYISQTTVIERDIRLEGLEVGMVTRIDTNERPIVGTVEMLNINLRGNRAGVRVIGNVDTTSNR